MDIKTSWGILEIKWVEDQVVGCTLPFLDREPKRPFSIESQIGDEASRFIAAIFQGMDPPVPALGKLNGTDFQQQVWHAISAIPKGQTRTYGELAKSIGRPSAFRAVANACGKNPVPLFIPCHRVVAAHGKLGGFSYGLPWKTRLLCLEQGS